MLFSTTDPMVIVEIINLSLKHRKELIIIYACVRIYLVDTTTTY